MSSSFAAAPGPTPPSRPRPPVRRLRALLLILGLLTGWVAWATTPTDVRVAVPHVHDGGGMLCYFGSLAMIVQQQEPELTYDQILRRSDLGSPFSEPEDMAGVASSLGFRMHSGGRRGLPGFLEPSEVTDPRRLEDPQQAMKALEDVLRHGRGALVCIELTPLASIRRALGLPGPYHGGHMIVVRGLAPEGVLIQDPQYPSPAGDDILLDRETFLEAWEAGSFGMIHLEKTAAPEAALLEKSLEGLEGSPARLRWLASYHTSREPVSDAIVMFVGGNVTRRRALAGWLREAGHEGAARLIELAAERYAAVNPMEQRDPRGTLLALAQLEEQALRQLGREPQKEVEWPEMTVLGPRFFDRGHERLDIRPGEGIGPVLLGARASDVIPRDWRLGPSGPYDYHDRKLRYQVYPDQGLMVAFDEDGRVRLLESRSSAHRFVLPAAERNAVRVRVGSPAREVVRRVFGKGRTGGGNQLDGRERLAFPEKGITVMVTDNRISGIEIYEPVGP